MNGQQLDEVTVKETYRIISVLLEQVEASNNLIAVMASYLGEETTRKVTQSNSWVAFMAAKRSLETIQPELKKYADTATRLASQMDEPE